MQGPEGAARLGCVDGCPAGCSEAALWRLLLQTAVFDVLQRHQRRCLLFVIRGWSRLAADASSYIVILPLCATSNSPH